MGFRNGWHTCGLVAPVDVDIASRDCPAQLKNHCGQKRLAFPITPTGTVIHTDRIACVVLQPTRFRSGDRED